MTGSIFRLSQNEAYQVAKAFQVEDRKKLRSRIHSQTGYEDIQIDIISFENNVAKYSSTGNSLNDFRGHYDSKMKG
jgi:hypothetical protein